MDKLFEEWIKQFELTPLDSVRKQTYAYEDMREAFEAGYHAAKDTALNTITEIINRS